MVRTFGIAPLVVQRNQIDGFIRLYKEMFSSDPYYEGYTDEWVREKVWDHHIKHGTIVLAEGAGGQIIGFACAVRLSEAPADVQEFLKDSWISGKLPVEFDPDRTWYMSELGVALTCERKEAAFSLIRNRLISASHAGMKHYLTRTDPDISISRRLYEKIGAKAIDHEQDMSTTAQVAVLGSRSTKRLYLYGQTSEALSKLTSTGSSADLDLL